MIKIEEGKEEEEGITYPKLESLDFFACKINEPSQKKFMIKN